MINRPEAMNPDTDILKEKIAKAGLQTPRILTLMITEACNLSCPHCLLNCKNLDAVPVRKEIIVNIIDEFSDLGGESLFITGGEPLSHPDWFDILDHACNSATFSEVTLQTNGAMVTDGDVEKLKSLNSEKLKIQVSLDGATPGINDMIRGKGSFAASLRALRLFVDAGMGKRIKIAFTEMKHNYNEMPAMLKLVDELGAGYFTAGTLVKGGRAKNTEWLDLPDRSQVVKLIELYESDPVFRSLYDKIGNISAIEWYKGRNETSDHVCKCISTPFINAAGKMYPCVMNLNRETAVDDVHEEGLKKSILKGLEKWSLLPELDRDRSESLDRCRGCAGREHCRGGCIGRAQASNGEAMSVEDRCDLRRAVYYYKEKDDSLVKSHQSRHSREGGSP
jgi:radical SAM protein with 4Fe4S-binding SPASM domain